MADIDDNASSREGGNRRRGRPEPRPGAGDRASSWLQVDEEANRIVIDAAAARRAKRPATEPAARDQRTRPTANAGRRRPAPQDETIEPVVIEAPIAAPYAIERPLETDGAVSDIPMLPLEPTEQELRRDLDDEVYIPAEERGRGRKRKRQQRRKATRAVTNPFGMIDGGDKPKGKARSPKWQKILMAVCGAVILFIGFVVLASGWVELPGLHRGVQIRNSIVYLSQVITLPYAPKSATWQVLTDEDQGSFGATKERLIAVMEFTPEQAAELMANAVPMPQPDDHQAIENELWFPDPAGDLMDDVDAGTLVYDASALTTSYFKRGIMLRLGDSGFVVAKMFNY